MTTERWVKERSHIQVFRHGHFLGWLVNHTLIVSDGDVVIFSTHTTPTGESFPIANTIPIGEIVGFLQAGDVLEHVS